MIDHPGFWRDREREWRGRAADTWVPARGKIVAREPDRTLENAPTGRVVGRRCTDGHLGVVFVDGSTGFYPVEGLFTAAPVTSPGPLFHLFPEPSF